ncbi:conjugal transfer protein [Photorhabdus heterorhabditis]|uniref:Conjugal transfer protein n=1 Tax=Photorhabdus heterorhabditis TaxID=880156 RepID=A0ABR5KE39_9GAMM|nr:TrbC family F-type conjugative pilus assembly protein [Photorhabdus heterorhabditis]KOY62845.1 conjugal transfer protein [Photorhabdus heterorhabditis]
MRSTKINSTSLLLLTFSAICSNAISAPSVQQYQHDAEIIARQAKALDGDVSFANNNPESTLPGNVPAPNINKYIQQAEKLKTSGVLDNKVNSGYVPGMHVDSVQAVIDQTRLIHESQQMGQIVEEISRRRDEIQVDAKANELAEQTVESKAKVMRSQATNIEKMFGSYGITASGWERKMDDNRSKELSTGIGLTIFASFSMPDYVFTDVLRTASEHNARVVLNGLKKGTTTLVETQAAIKQYIVKAKLKNEPLITLDPESFSQYQVTQVPTMISRTENRFARIAGTFNVDYFEREMKSYPNRDIFPVAGTTYLVEEKSIIKELEERGEKYDWESAKKRALGDTWKNQWMINLPPAYEYKEWLIDPTIRVTQDVKDRQGRTLAYAGEMINPLTRFPQNLTMLIFDPMRLEQVEWAEKKYKSVLGSGKVLPMFTRIDITNGWDDLNDLREKFNGKVFKVNEQIIRRFHVKATPVVISADHDKFRVVQFSEAEIKGTGTPASAQEK